MPTALRTVVVGAGAWGLPAAAELARRGCLVTLIDAFLEDGEQASRKTLGSSSGPTRIWRLVHPDRIRVRLAQRAVESWRRLERDALGRDGLGQIAAAKGILWRDAERPLVAVAEALRREGVAFTEVPARSVSAFFPGMAADSRDALWQPEAGVVMAERAMRAHAELFARAGGERISGERVVKVSLGGGGGEGGGRGDDARSLLRSSSSSFSSSSSSSSAPVTVFTGKGRTIEADVVVLAPGTGATSLSNLFPSTSSSSSSSIFPRSVSRNMRPRMQQTAHVSRPGLTDALPCWYDGPREIILTEEEEMEREREEARERGATEKKKKPRPLPGLYAMPTPGVGYKIGLDAPVRFIGGAEETGGSEGDDEGAFEPRIASDDFSREPSERANAAIEARARESLPGLLTSSSVPGGGEKRPLVHSAQVCTWTDSPDGRFVVDALAGGRVIVAAGCSGEGFKFSALMGLVLADLAQGKAPDEDVASFGLKRFEEGLLREDRGKAERHVLGR